MNSAFIEKKGEFSDLQRLIKFITRRSSLNKALKDILQQEENQRQKEGLLHKSKGKQISKIFGKSNFHYDF